VDIWPAIDIRGGKCVRLRQGDYAQETVFGDDPVEMASHWVEQGAERFHLVDLDGARSGEPTNIEVVARIAAETGVPCELGGGIRDEATIVRLLEAGLTRLVIGSLAVREPDWFVEMARKYPDKMVLGLDAKDGRVATDGWIETSDVDAVTLAKQYAVEPIAAIIYTDIATDGMMQGANVEAMAEMHRAVDVPLVASGGVSTIDDVVNLARAGLHGCIIGRAMYEGVMTPAAAKEAAEGAV